MQLLISESYHICKWSKFSNSLLRVVEHHRYYLEGEGTRLLTLWALSKDCQWIGYFVLTLSAEKQLEQMEDKIMGHDSCVCSSL